jgi:hypothetical protein
MYNGLLGNHHVNNLDSFPMVSHINKYSPYSSHSNSCPYELDRNSMIASQSNKSNSKNINTIINQDRLLKIQEEGDENY